MAPGAGKGISMRSFIFAEGELRTILHPFSDILEIDLLKNVKKPNLISSSLIL
jgi:hypothetical protein